MVKTRKIKPEVIAVLASAKLEGNKLVLSDQLERRLYLETDKVLKSLGGKWDRRAKGHVFAEESGDSLAEKVEGAVLTGEFSYPPDLGYFPTPPALVERLLSLADVRHGHQVLEPSAGEGAIANELVCLVGHGDLLCIEIDPTRANLLKRTVPAHQVICGDFLQISPPVNQWTTFDRVVMNPPFAKQQDVEHVSWAWKFLRPGGRIVAVMSAGFTFRDNFKSRVFRENVEKYGRWEDNPDGTFKVSGTDVHSVTVVLDKPE